jgi:competence protein ComEC
MRDTAPPLTTPLYWLAAGLLAGQLVAAEVPALAVTAVAAAAALACAVAARRRRPLLAAALLLAAFAVGHRQVARLLHAEDDAHGVAALHGARAWIRGVVVEPPRRGPGGLRLVVAADAARRGGDWRAAAGTVQLGIRHPTRPWARGDGIEALVAVRRPRNFGNPGEFDYRAYLLRRGISATGFAPDDRGWRRTPGAEDWLAPLARWRSDTAAMLAATLPRDDAAIAAALLIGDLDGVSDAQRSRYARAGVSHVLSISGLHVGLVAAGAYVLLRALLARSERLLLTASVPKLAMAGSLAPLALYGAIAGSNIATVRAELMAALVAAGLLLDRPREWLAPLAAAATLLMLARPGAAADISFQLSFVAVLAILLGVPRLTAWWDAWEEARLLRLRDARWRWVRWMVLSQAVTACAVLGTAPLAAWHFNQISLVAPLANLIVVPLLGVVTVAAGLVATLAVALWPAVAPPLVLLIGRAIHLADLVIAWLAAWPWAAVRVPTPTLVELGLCYAALGGCLLPRRRLAVAVVAGAFAGLALDAALWTVERRAAGTLRVTFVSVGQGDCTLIEFPGAAVWVVDGGGLAGGRLDVGERVVAPALWRRKIMRLDRLVLSHADYDHYGGLTFLAATFAPPRLWWNGRPGTGAGFAALQRALTRGRVLRRQPSPGDEEPVDGVAVRVLHPAADAAGSDNDRSLTIQLRYGPTTVLLPGDIEAAGEAALVARWGARLRSTILKVPHHGSATSSTPALLDAVAPRLAVVSAGVDNRFGFPAAGIERAYAERGVPLWRTDRDGAVALTITADGAIAARSGRGRALAVTPAAASLDSQKSGSLKGGVADLR